MDEILIVATVFFSFVAMLYIWFHTGMKKEYERQKTIRAALEKGQDLTPEIINSLAAQQIKSKYHDLRIGLPVVGLSIGWMLYGYLGVHDMEVAWAAAFPLFFGLGFIASWYISTKES